MPTALKDIGSPRVGDGIEFGLQATGANCRTIVRRYEMRTVDQDSYISPVIGATLLDPVYTTAILTSQRVLPIPGNKTDCILERTFSEVPTEWDDYDEVVVTFPGVQSSPFYAGGAFFAFRTQPESELVPVRIRKTYFLSNPLRIHRSPVFKPVDKSGNRVTLLTSDTSPSSDEYLAMAKASSEFIYRVRVHRWRGDIWVRETIYARAQ